MDENDNLYIGTKNERIRWLKVPDYLLSIARAPPGKIWDAVVDGFLRQWSGTPFFESDGAEIYYYNQKDFELVFKAPKEHMGFRSMVYYQNEVYTGSSNGPDGPFDGDPYDFQFYKEGTGAKIFTTKNATTGQVFVQLDDQGLLDNFDKSIRSMCVSSYSDRLFIGTETYKCGKILVYDNTNGMNIWKQVETNEEDCSLSVSECLDIGEGRMLFGTWAAADYGLYLLDEKNQDSLTRIDTPNCKFCHVHNPHTFSQCLN